MLLRRSQARVFAGVFWVVFAGSGLSLQAQRQPMRENDPPTIPNLVPLARAAGAIFSGSYIGEENLRQEGR